MWGPKLPCRVTQIGCPPPCILVQINILGVFRIQLLENSPLPPWSVQTLACLHMPWLRYTNKPVLLCSSVEVGSKKVQGWNEILGTPIGAVFGAGLTEITCSAERNGRANTTRFTSFSWRKPLCFSTSHFLITKFSKNRDYTSMWPQDCISGHPNNIKTRFICLRGEMAL